MKRFILAILTFAAWTVLLAQPFTEIRPTHDLSYTGSSLQVPGGGLFTVYRDTIQGNHDLYAQRFSADGTPLWQNPVPVAIKDAPIIRPTVTLCSDGGFFVTWQEDDPQQGGVFAQKLSSTGQMLWQEAGIMVFNPLKKIDYVKLVPNASGGAFVLASSPEEGYYNCLWGANINGEGQNNWQTGGQALLTFPVVVRLMQAVADGEGGMIVNLIKDNPDSSEGYVRRIDENGTGVGANPLFVDPGFQNNLFTLHRDFQGNFLIFGNSATFGFVRFNKVNNQGQFLMANAVEQTMEASTPYYTEAPDGSLFLGWISMTARAQYLKIRKFAANYNSLWAAPASQYLSSGWTSLASLEADASGGVFYAWNAILSSGEPSQVRLQRFDQNGLATLGENGVLLSARGSNDQPGLHPLGSNMMLLWTDRDDGKVNLKHQVFDPTGNSQIPSNQETLVSRPFGNASVKASLTLPDGFMLVWNDGRDYPDGSIYYQKTSFGLQSQYEEGGRLLAGGAAQLQIWEACANAAGEVLVAYRTGDNDGYNCHVQIISTNGQPFYPGNGILISPDAMRVNVSSSGNDFYIGWVTENEVNDDFIMGQRISGGSLMWEPEGKVIKAYNYNNRVPALNLLDRYFIWNERTNMSYDHALVRALHLEPNGSISTGWEPEGKLVATYSTGELQDLGWSGLIGDDLVALVRGSFPPRMQRISPNGTKLWGMFTVVLSSAVNSTQGVAVASGDLISIIFPYYDDASNAYKIVLQKVNHDGEILCGNNGLVIMENLSWLSSQLLLDRGEGMLSLLLSNSRYAYAGDSLYDLVHYPINALGEVGQGLSLNLAMDSFGELQVAEHDGSLLLAVEDCSFHSNYSYAFNHCLKATLLGAPPSSIPEENNVPSVLITQPKGIPNPFTTSTQIRFDLARAATVKLSIFNLRGQLIREIRAAQSLNPGSQSLDWDGKDQAGRELPSGVYLLKIEAGGDKGTGKLLKLH